MNTGKRGFTLVEVLIVLAIIGLLLSIAVPALSARKRKAEQAVELANARMTYRAAVAKILTEGISLDELRRQYWFGYSITAGNKTYTATIDIGEYSDQYEAIDAMFVSVFAWDGRVAKENNELGRDNCANYYASDF